MKDSTNLHAPPTASARSRDSSLIESMGDLPKGAFSAGADVANHWKQVFVPLCRGIAPRYGAFNIPLAPNDSHA
jgi:hypothetical protein